VSYDLTVVGGGPAGYAAALLGAASGLSVALVERRPPPGTPAAPGRLATLGLLETARVARTVTRAPEFGVLTEPAGIALGRSLERATAVADELRRALEALFAARSVTVVPGSGSLSAPGLVVVESPSGTRAELRSANVVLAAGARPVELPGLAHDGTEVLCAGEVLGLDRLPETAAVVGGGRTGCELASALCDLGTRVTLLEAAPMLLPSADEDLIRHVERAFSRRGIEVRTAAEVRGAKRGGHGVQIDAGDGGQLNASVVVIALGRRPEVGGVLGAASGVEVGADGAVRVDAFMRTTADGVFAIGEVVAAPGAEQVGVAEAELVVRQLLGEQVGPLDVAFVPWCAYCEPEVACVGMTEDAARRSGRDVVIVRDGFSANSRARIIGAPEGFVKVVAERDKDGRAGSLFGVHMVGPRVSEQLGQAGLAVVWGASPAELAGLVQPHPTLSEVYGEALLALAGRGLHT
jgi:dihydrolipoamide dehydrogenase